MKPLEKIYDCLVRANALNNDGRKSNAQRARRLKHWYNEATCREDRDLFRRYKRSFLRNRRIERLMRSRAMFVATNGGHFLRRLSASLEGAISTGRMS
ncbi:MAG: hypothetical protein LBV12_08815 [Puniceicoccales bacterium]|jgi:hypothetical protein|nr:hypothetical protein [Puniceicoccales bacterium]